MDVLYRGRASVPARSALLLDLGLLTAQLAQVVQLGATDAPRVKISMWSMLGECTGKVRSTPTP